MPRSKSLTEADIAVAALAVIDRQGLAALSMRALADELGFGVMSLYRYVSDRRQVERLVVERVLADIDLTPPPRTSWTKRIVLFADRVRAAVGAHPGVVPLLMTHRNDCAGVARCIEALLAALADGGVNGRQRVVAVRALAAYINGALMAQAEGPLQGAGTQALAALDAAQFPLLVEAARSASRVAPEEEFHEGLALLLRGLAPA
jgi:AcrR family transcriptional regulator